MPPLRNDEPPHNDNTILYRWILGILIAIMMAGLGYVIDALSRDSKAEHHWMNTRINEQGAQSQSMHRQMTVHTERLAVIEWQIKVMEQRIQELYQAGSKRQQ
jgi:hypothetical protein